MSTIEQRACKFADDFTTYDSHALAPLLHRVSKDVYIKGATEQRAIDIEKAAVWLASELDSNCSNIIVGHEEVSVSDLIARFKKAMEL